MFVALTVPMLTLRILLAWCWGLRHPRETGDNEWWHKPG